ASDVPFAPNRAGMIGSVPAGDRWRFVMVHLPFTDRRAAGQLLANELCRHNISGTSVVLALPRGGVPVGFVVAEQLHLPLDVVVVRKLGVPWQPELAMG